jgi:hypothetical protein
MKGTLISIFIGAVAGVLLTVGPALHSSHADTRSRHAPVDAVSSPRHADGNAHDSSTQRDAAPADAEQTEPK